MSCKVKVEVTCSSYMWRGCPNKLETTADIEASCSEENGQIEIELYPNLPEGWGVVMYSNGADHHCPEHWSCPGEEKKR